VFFGMLKQTIKIWGNEKNAKNAYTDFTSFAETIISDIETSPKKGRGWSKPEKELTDKQLRRKERAERKLAELRKYQGFPDPEIKFPHVVRP
jgi:hypothetical protein